MAIKIPSYMIYGTGVDSALINKNKIEQADISADYFSNEYGNVLIKEYIINYYEEVGESDAEFVGNNSNKTDFYIASPQWIMGLLFSPNLIANNFKIGQHIGFTEDYKGKVEGYTVIRRKNWVDLSVSKDNPKRYWQREEQSSEGISYNKDINSFSYNIGTDVINSATGIAVGGDFTFDGATVNSRLLSETITINGIYRKTEAKIFSKGSSYALRFSLPSNELVQTGNTINGNNLNTLILENVVNKYANGKEVYTIKCSVGEYYDIYGAKAIDPYDTNFPATFEKHDIVEPYVFTSQGEVPLSEKADGTPKQFEIIGIDYSYKGVVWQELTLQEYIQ